MTPADPDPADLVFFLGGRDLEMVAARDLIRDSPAGCHDRGLAWGAAASAYRDEIAAARRAGRTVVLVELDDDLGLTAGPPAAGVRVVDHHGPRAGADRPTALEQVFALLRRPPAAWTRWHTLVAANDRGHIPGLFAAGATPAEVAAVRAADRAAQGITPAEEAAGRAAAAAAEQLLGGRLTLVRLPHARTATVTDALAPALGGPGWANLLVLSPGEVNFFGTGAGVRALAAAVPGGHTGGALPAAGFWGHPGGPAAAELIPVLDRSLPMPDPTPPEPTRSAADIPVRAYRQILIWPLLLKEIHNGAPKPVHAAEFEEWLALIGGVWGAEVSTLPAAVTPAMGDDITYEEMIYFHPHVRDFLYGDGARPAGDRAAERPLRRFRRRDIRQATMTLADGTAVAFDVPRLELYLCKPLVALLVVELVATTALTLAAAMAVQSAVRQVYPPYFIPQPGGGPELPGNCPREVTWVCANRTEIRSDYDRGREHFARDVHPGAEPPVASHWAALFPDAITPFRGNLPNADGRYYQQIEDDRIPGMTFLTVDDPRAISDGDYDRLTLCDTAGPAPTPYAEGFLADRRAAHAYDRFWQRDPGSGRVAGAYDTRYLCSGYQFVMVVNQANPLCPVLQDHFGRHYFRLGLLLHFQRAALLKFADDIAEAIKLLRDESPTEDFTNAPFCARVTYTQMAFLKFRARAWFSDVSNQVQGQELFDWWAARLGTGPLFKHVDRTSERLYAAVAEHETRTLTKSQEQLATIATLLLPFGFTVGVLTAFMAAIADVKYSADRVTNFGLLLALALVAGFTGATLFFRTGAAARVKEFFAAMSALGACSGGRDKPRGRT